MELAINIIEKSTAAYLKSKYSLTDLKLQVQKTRPEFEGDLTLVTFPLTTLIKKKPEEIGKEIGNFLCISENYISSYNIVKGFLNISFSDKFWLKSISKTQSENLPANGETVVVEYSSPNTNKPLHLGHVRNNLLGYSVAEIYKANGYNVKKVQVINDRGIHICKSMLAWQLFGEGKTPESESIKGDHFVGDYYIKFDQEYKKEIADLINQGKTEAEAKENASIMLQAREMLQKWEQGDLETMKLWETMNSWVYAGFESTYNRLGVDFDKNYYESSTYLLGKKVVAEGLSKGVFYQEADNSVWIDLTDIGLDKKIVQRSDGTSVYMTQDIGTAIQRFEDFGMNSMVYTVGSEQDYHFKVLFEILKKLGYAWAERLFHLSYGMVELPSGKMKSREGNVVDADDLMEGMHLMAKQQSEEFGKTGEETEEYNTNLFEQIGLAGLKYFILKVDPKKKMLFNPEESIDLHGNTGTFLQYSYARMNSIINKAINKSLDYSVFEADSLELENQELDLIKLIYENQDILKTAALELSPAVVANHTYEIAKAYNRFYTECPIFREPSPKQNTINFRLFLTEKTKKCLEFNANLLGIEMPEKM